MTADSITWIQVSDDAVKIGLGACIAGLFSWLVALGVAIVSGCTTPAGSKPERGPEGTIAYFVEMDSSEPGARIEVNNEDIGKTPMTLKIFGDKDGTFHNFGSYHFTITAYPVKAGQPPQTKDFRTGGWFTPEDRIPKRIFLTSGVCQRLQSRGVTELVVDQFQEPARRQSS